MTLTAVKEERLTVTLSNHPPVLIKEDDWPVLSHGSFKIDNRDRMRGSGYAYDINIYVRQHDDGRSLVYAIYSSSDFAVPRAEYRAGRLLQKDEDIKSTIRWVADQLIFHPKV